MDPVGYKRINKRTDPRAGMTANPDVASDPFADPWPRVHPLLTFIPPMASGRIASHGAYVGHRTDSTLLRGYLATPIYPITTNNQMAGTMRSQETERKIP